MKREMESFFYGGISVASILFSCYFVGCIQPSSPPSKPSTHALRVPAGATLSERHPAIKVKAAGLKPILKEFFPQLQKALREDFVKVVPGVEAQVGEIDVTISQLTDGRVLIDLGKNGQKIRVDKTVLGFINLRATEKIGSMVIDENGVDVNLDDSFLIHGLRLEAAD